ncbi:Uncharacterised protein [Vibrio cholerae]|nr:Uncharacterised protein [Vibrio cholerae]CSB16256.1 Uncharacterised protein [Vibrio cholerae]
MTARSGTRTDDGVNFIDKQDGVFLFLKLFQNRFETFFEITTIFGAR